MSEIDPVTVRTRTTYFPPGGPAFGIDPSIDEAGKAAAAEIDQLHQRNGGDPAGWPPGQRQRLENLQRRVAHLAESYLGQQRAALDRQAQRTMATPAMGETVSNDRAGYGGQTPAPAQRVEAWGQGDLSAIRGRALAAIDQAAHATDDARHRMAALLDHAVDEGEIDLAARWTLATIRPEYERACAKLFRDPINGHREFAPEELAAFQQAKTVQRAMSLTDAQGGFLVPFTLDPAINLSNVGSVNPLRRISRVATTATDTWSGITSAGVTASWYLENNEVTDDSPTFLSPTITPQRASAFVAASIEVAMDSRIGDQLREVFSDAKDNLEATSMTTGSGTPPTPKGIITALVAAGTPVIATATNVLAQADLYNNQAALPPRWRPRGRWMMNLSIINGYRQLPQATGLNYSIINDDGPQPKALGWVVEENSAMDGTLSAGADYTVLSGDFRQFAVVDRIGLQVEFIPHLFGAAGRPKAQRGWFAYWRAACDVLIPDAFRLTNHST